MVLFVEIALGVICGICLLRIAFEIIPEWWRRRENERSSQPSVEARSKPAPEQGFPLDGIIELGNWEREHDRSNAWTIARAEINAGGGLSSGSHRQRAVFPALQKDATPEGTACEDRPAPKWIVTPLSRPKTKR